MLVGQGKINNIIWTIFSLIISSVNDARVLRNSALATRFEAGWRPFANGILLGDSIYGASDWLIPMRASAAPQYARFYQYAKCHNMKLLKL